MLSACLLVLAGVAAASTVTTDHSVAANRTFDYVIAGGGLAGLTVGNKLSGEGYSVLIIESGPDAEDVPYIRYAEERQYPAEFCNWKYPAYDESGSTLSWTIDSGKCVGGSSSMNGMVWFRPTRTELDLLQDLGNPGWNSDSLVPYLDAIERFTPPDEIQISEGAGYDPAVHGYNGPINTSFPTPMRIPKAQALYKQAVPIVFPGLTVGNDLSNRTSTGTASASNMWTIWYDPVTQKNIRSSAAYGLLYAPDQQRESLVVLAEHNVARVLFNSGRDLTARGVVFGNASDGGLYEVYASKEVILSAGSLASAPILERSGIGNSAVLKKAGVKQVLDLPGVGLNLNDQPGTGTSALVATEFQNDTQLIDDRNLFAPFISLVNSDMLFGSSSTATIAKNLTSSIASRAAALVKAGAAATYAGAFAVLGATTDLIVNHKFPVTEVVGETYPTILNVIFWPMLPFSRGHIHINSSDPFALPRITPRFLTDEFDQKVAVAVARKSREIFLSEPFASEGIVADAYADPSDVGANATDEQYLEWYRNTSAGASHWLGSTSMLPRAFGGVVDSRLRVYGTRNLRVVDAGVFPIPLTIHTMSALYAVAQRGADLILDDA